MTDDVLIRERMSRAAEGATSSPDLDAVVRRSQTLRRRRVAGTILIATVLMLGVAVPLDAPLCGTMDRWCRRRPVRVRAVCRVRGESQSVSVGRAGRDRAGGMGRPGDRSRRSSPHGPRWPRGPTTSRVLLIACGVQPALERLPDVFLWIFEYGPPGEGDPDAGDHPAWPARFMLDLPHRAGDRECAAGTADVRDYRFWATDHTVQVLVGIGAERTTASCASSRTSSRATSPSPTPPRRRRRRPGRASPPRSSVDHDREEAVGVDDDPRLALRELGERPRPGSRRPFTTRTRPPATPAASRSRSPAFSCTFPKPSTAVTQAPTRRRHHRRRQSSRTRDAGSTGGPSSSSGIPVARWAAAGAGVPPVERPRDGLEDHLRARDLHRRLHAAERAPREREHAVVGTDQERVAGRRRHGASVGPHARIDDGHVDRILRQVGHRARDLDGATEDVLTGHGCEVDHAGGRRDPRDHAVADPDEGVAPPVVGEEDDRSRHPSTGT